MVINSPCMITSRLLPGLRIGDATISIEYGDETRDGRQGYRWYIDLADGREFSGDDLASGVGGGSLQSGLESLLSFLGACGESYAYDVRRGGDGTGGENSDLFPAAVAEWAAQNSDELSMAALELEESTEPVIVE
jgi:hypothetical protein